MAEPVWLDGHAFLSAHNEVIALTGGAAGTRDEGLLQSALGRPLNAFSYEAQEDIAVLAATYAVAIARNHPFIDGNKRAAFLAMVVFMAQWISAYRLSTGRHGDHGGCSGRHDRYRRPRRMGSR